MALRMQWCAPTMLDGEIQSGDVIDAKTAIYLALCDLGQPDRRWAVRDARSLSLAAAAVFFPNYPFPA